MVQSALSIIHLGNEYTSKAFSSLKRGLILMEIDKDHKVFTMIENRIHYDNVIRVVHGLIPDVLYEEFAVTEIVMES